MIKSLRFRLLVRISAAVAIILGLLGVALYFCLGRAANSDFNQALLTEARAVAGTAEQHGSKIIFDFAPEEFPQFSGTDHSDYFQAWIDSGYVLRSVSLGDGDLPRPTAGRGITFIDGVLPDGRPGRMVSMSFTSTIEPNAQGNSSSSESPHEVVMTVATDTIALNRTLENFRWILFGLCSLAVIISGATLVWVVGREVRPVERLGTAIDAMQENNLSVRLDAPDVPSELSPVVEKLNGLLSRLNKAFTREKAFTADVAHELRNPLAAIITTFDVCRTRQRDEPAYIAAIDKCRAVAGQMQAMVETLLVLTRADAGQLSLEMKRVNLANLLNDCWGMFLPRAQARGLQVQWQVPESIFVETDPDKLRIILHNLFDNAVSYADDAGSIRVNAELAQDQLQVEVANTGSRIASDKIEQLFDRFWRGDQARTDTGTHCGLGLSLCKRLSGLLNGRIEIESTAQKWFIVRLLLPATGGQTAVKSDAISPPISQSSLFPAEPAPTQRAEVSSEA